MCSSWMCFTRLSISPISWSQPSQRQTVTCSAWSKSSSPAPPGEPGTEPDVSEEISESLWARGEWWCARSGECVWSEKAIEAARLGVRGGGWAAGESMEESTEEREEGGEDIVVVLGGGVG